MKIVIGSDHAAFEAKEKLKGYLAKHFDLDDVGPDSDNRCNYPDYAIALAKKVTGTEVLGILLCGSGIGVSMTANRFKGIRAALCRTPYEAQLSKEHNDSNVLCLGARISNEQQIKDIVDAWLKAEFEGGRHSERLAIFDQLGE